MLTSSATSKLLSGALTQPSEDGLLNYSEPILDTKIPVKALGKRSSWVVGLLLSDKELGDDKEEPLRAMEDPRHPAPSGIQISPQVATPCRMDIPLRR